MAITYSINEDQGIVYSEFSEIVGLHDFSKHFNELRSNSAFRSDLGNLCDWRKLENLAIDFSGMQCITAECPWGTQSYRAIVVSRPVVFGMSRMYQSMASKSHGTIQIFQNIQDAEAWLQSVLKH